MPLIDKYSVVSNTDSGRVDQVDIHIPSWVYDSVVRDKQAPQILTLNLDYFLISQGLGRFIYRLARRSAGREVARYSMSEVHKRSGSLQAMPQFAQLLRELVDKTKVIPFPDYDLDLISGLLCTSMLRQEFVDRVSWRTPDTSKCSPAFRQGFWQNRTSPILDRTSSIVAPYI